MNSSTPVVFLHGFATSTDRTWREPGWFDLVTEGGRRPVGIDLLGHGSSPKPHEPEAYAALTDLVIDKLPVSADGSAIRQIDMVGYSLGARTALDIAIRHPDLIDRLVLGGVGENLVRGGSQSDMTADHHETDNHETDNHESDNVGYRFEGLISSADNDPEALAALRTWMADNAQSFTAEQLAEVKSRCLLVIGDEDFVGRPEPLADLLGNADTVVLPGVDHFSLPKQFAFIDAALEFLDAVPKW